MVRQQLMVAENHFKASCYPKMFTKKFDALLWYQFISKDYVNSPGFLVLHSSGDRELLTSSTLPLHLPHCKVFDVQ